MSRSPSREERADDGSRQVALYGVSWADRLGGLMHTLDISQARLAEVLGLSRPMVSQLISGQRVKISNPVVYGRLVRLEELASGTVPARDRAVLRRSLDDIMASEPILTTTTVSGDKWPRSSDGAPPSARAAAAGYLASFVGRVDLERGSKAASGAGAGALADFLIEAATLAGAGPGPDGSFAAGA